MGLVITSPEIYITLEILVLCQTKTLRATIDSSSAVAEITQAFTKLHDFVVGNKKNDNPRKRLLIATGADIL